MKYTPAEWRHAVMMFNLRLAAEHAAREADAER